MRIERCGNEAAERVRMTYCKGSHQTHHATPGKSSVFLHININHLSQERTFLFINSSHVRVKERKRSEKRRNKVDCACWRMHHDAARSRFLFPRNLGTRYRFHTQKYTCCIFEWPLPPFFSFSLGCFPRTSASLSFRCTYVLLKDKCSRGQ